jgi:hypothetical protein
MRSQQVLFTVAWLALGWLGMQAVHEAGHVAGAWVSGGNVRRVVLHPLAISRTDVAPNPHPALVVWAGPVLGCLVPLLLFVLVPRRRATARALAQFFAGFCLLANGAYIALGSFDAVGDCGEMLRTGTPHWVMIAFGLITMPLGLVLWHRLGSVRDFVARPELIGERLAWGTLATLVVVIVAEVLLG